jgi:putative adhesin
LNTKLLLAAIGLGTGCLLFAADAPEQRMPNLGEPKPAVQASKTDRFDFPANGTLRFINSVGVLTVEAWDRPDVEITTIKSTKTDVGAGGLEKTRRNLDKVNVATDRHGDELVVTTTFPWHRPFRMPYPLSGNTGFNLEYRIKAPASARIVARHTLGEVNVDGFTGDVQVNLAQGEILLHLPEGEKYSIRAQSDFGSVNSDFSELEKRTGWFLGHRSVDKNSATMHKLDLRVGFGDIVILKARVPKSPGPVTPAPKADGL